MFTVLRPRKQHRTWKFWVFRDEYVYYLSIEEKKILNGLKRNRERWEGFIEDLKIEMTYLEGFNDLIQRGYIVGDDFSDMDPQVDENLEIARNLIGHIE